MNSYLDLSFYLVTNRGKMPHEEFYDVIQKTIEGGVKIVQLREKEASAREMIDMGKALLSFLKPLGIPLIINDRVDVAHAVKADGVHLGQSDLTVAEARAILGKKAIIGLSVETLTQVAAIESTDIDYLAASPVFVTKTKLTCNHPWGLDGLKELCLISRYPIVAIGGINETNVAKVLECGAAGVAFVSAIFDAPCPKAAAVKVAQQMKRKKH